MRPLDAPSRAATQAVPKSPAGATPSAVAGAGTREQPSAAAERSAAGTRFERSLQRARQQGEGRIGRRVLDELDAQTTVSAGSRREEHPDAVAIALVAPMGRPLHPADGATALNSGGLSASTADAPAATLQALARSGAPWQGELPIHGHPVAGTQCWHVELREPGLPLQSFEVLRHSAEHVQLRLQGGLPPGPVSRWPLERLRQRLHAAADTPGRGASLCIEIDAGAITTEGIARPQAAEGDDA